MIPVEESELTIAVDDFVIMRRPPLTPEVKAGIDERDRLNAEFLSHVAAPPLGGVLSGSFIYAHPPDYRGRSTLHYTEQDWVDLFREFKELGIHTAVLQAAIWAEFRECYYPSKLFPGFRTWNVLDPMIKASTAENMTLYLSPISVLYGHIELGSDKGDVKKAKKAAERELKSITPDLPILTSPYTMCCHGREQEATDYLTRLHEGCPINVFAPQDSIGTSCSNLTFLENGLTIWKNVSRHVGADFWVNCESFSITDYGGPICKIESADFKRFAVQLDTAARLGAKKMITWEAPYFLARDGEERARKLRRDYLKNRQVTAMK
jgi:hypothetical protein